MHVGQPWLDALEAGGRVMLTTPADEFIADFLITGTGVSMDPGLLPELTHCAHNIAQRGDRYAPPGAERNPRLLQFRYLGPDSAFLKKTYSETP